MRELAAKLDELDVLLHELHSRLAKEEERQRDSAGTSSLPSRCSRGDDPNKTLT